MKNFFDSNSKTITEKAFSHSLIISVFSILMCLILLCSMTYAWFSADVSSSSNTLMSGFFDIKDITIVKEDTKSTVLVEKDTDDPGVYHCKLPANGTYIVTLTLDDEATAKGYCVVTINGTDKNTVAIIGKNTAKDGYSENSPFEFTISTIAEKATDVEETTDVEEATYVEFKVVWGVVANPDIQAGDDFSVYSWKEDSTQESES